MKSRKHLATPIVLMLVTGSFLFSRTELSQTRSVDIALLIVFGALLGHFLTVLRIHLKKQ